LVDEKLKLEALSSSEMLKILSNSGHKVKSRLAVLRNLEAFKADNNLEAALKELAVDLQNDLRIYAAVSLLRLEPLQAIEGIMTILEKGSDVDRQIIIPQLTELKSVKFTDYLKRALGEMQASKKARVFYLELIEAAEKSQSEDVKILLEKFKTTDLLNDWRFALRGGNAKRGRRVLYNHGTAQCIRCHKVRGYGGDAGPDLGTVGDRYTRPYLLEALVQPGNAVAPGYGMITIELKSGVSVSGAWMKEEEGGFVLKMPDGELRVIKKEDIKSTGKVVSSMPPMHHILKRHELRDVLEFLTTLKEENFKKKGH